MSEADHERVAHLLHIAEACGGHSGKLSNLQGWAIGELMAINDQIKKAAVAKAESDRKAAEVELRDAPDMSLGAEQVESNGNGQGPTIADRRI
jgi:hypothetical protein